MKAAGVDHAYRVVAAIFASLALSFLLAPPSAQAAGDAVRGKVLVATWCSSCHQIGPAFPARGPGPPFASIANNTRYSDRYIKDWVTHPHTTMPHFRFTEQVLDDLISYFASLRVGDPADGVTRGDESAVRQYSTGSGFFIGANGDVLTAAHNVRQCKRIGVSLPGMRSTEARLMHEDRTLDLALLRTDRRPAAFARFRTGMPLLLGERIVSFSYPLSGTLSSSGNLSAGFVAALNGIGDSPDEFQISADLHPGSSGGPVLDRWARVVGVAKSRLVATAARDAPPTGVNFAVSGRAVRLFLAGMGYPLAGSDAGAPLDLATIAEISKSYTVRVICSR